MPKKYERSLEKRGYGISWNCKVGLINLRQRADDDF